MTENPSSAGENAESLPEGSSCLCPLGGIMDLLSRRYAIQVVCVVGALGPVRYSEIEAAFGEVSASTLSTRLAELTEADLLDRERYAEIPPRVEYDLTTDGEGLAEVLKPLLRWADGRDATPSSPDFSSTDGSTPSSAEEKTKPQW